MRGNALKVDRMGRVLIPAAVRKRLSLEPGTELRLTEDGGKLILQPRQQALLEAQAIVRSFVSKGVSLVDELIAERREAERRELED
jgi:AbrB family looped-hinge helix DNA binding protein